MNGNQAIAETWDAELEAADAWCAEMEEQFRAYMAASPAERQRVIVGREPSWSCPYCGKDYGPHPDPHHAAIQCCGEIGHLEQRGDDEAF